MPWVIRRWLPAIDTVEALRLPWLPQSSTQRKHRATPTLLAAACLWLGLVAALARPVWYGEPIEFQPKHRDLMLLVDLSGSMEQRDMMLDGDYVDRLTAVKHVVSQFASERNGDRLGLVVFADHAYLQTPLTYDRSSVVQQLQQMVIGLVGSNTAIGDGIGLATKSFVDSEAPQRVMILLSDGANTAGTLSPEDAARIAAKYQAKLYTIGIGAGEMEVDGFLFSRTVNTARDLDESTLSAIAKATGGQYFRAKNATDLTDIYQVINQLEPINQQVQIWRPQSEWFYYPLAMSLVIGVLLILLGRVYD
nr:VWA domain-containing protein [Vibrio agarilyticus]